MLYKENWEETKERMAAFWEGEVMDRPCMDVACPRAEQVRPAPKDFKQKWTDPGFLLHDQLAICRAHYFGGEAIPSKDLMVGFAFAYNAPLHFTEWTILHEPIFKTADDYKHFDFDYSKDFGWQQCKKVVEFLAHAGVGKFVVSQPDILPGNDLLAVLRGTQNFLTDLILNPDEVKDALKRMRNNWLTAFMQLDQIIKAEGVEGSSSWLGIWSPKTTATLQSDVSCMISPEMFEEFIVPELEQAADAIDHVFYHLDGPDAIKHLDRLLEIESIFGIQWSPGAGAPQEIEDWLDMYKKIQAKGKGLHPPSIPKEKLEFAIRELNPKGLFLHVHGAQSVAEVEAILKKAEKLTAKYW